MAAADRTGNLGPNAQTSKMQLGVVMFGISLALASWMLKTSVSTVTRLVLFLPFFVAALSLIEGLMNTCSVLSARGMRDLGDGPEKIASRTERCAVKATALHALLLGALVSAAATALFVALP